MRTPRLLKSTLGRFNRAWDELHGEIDIDELLITCCLRTCVPDVFQFVSERIGVLKALSRQKLDRFDTERVNQQIEVLKSNWNSIEFAKELDRRDAAVLIQKLIPPSKELFNENSYSVSESLQAVSGSGPTNYWGRLISESLLESEMRDQEVLRLISDSNNREDSLPVPAKRIVHSGKFAANFEHFAKLLKDDRLFNLASLVNVNLRENNGNKACEDDYGFAEMRRVLLNRFRGSENLSIWVINEIEPCVPGYLRLLAGIYFMWLSDADSQSQERFRRRMLQVCQAKYQVGDPKIFANSFDPDFPFTLSHLVFTSEYQQNPPPPIIGPEFWSWLAPILLESAKAVPDKMVPQIAVMLESERQQRDPRLPADFQIDTDMLQRFFGSLTREMLIELSKPIALSERLDPRVRETLGLVATRAKEILNKTSAGADGRA